MNLKTLFLGGGEFKSPSDIIRVVPVDATDFDPQEDIDHAASLLIFQTSKQQTWLVATDKRLYCVLDDLPLSFTRVQWSMSKDILTSGGDVTVSIGTRDKTDRTGLLDIGKHTGWLFTKKLFSGESIDARVKRLIRQQMLP